MYSLMKGSNGITLVPVETRLMSHRKIFIEGEIAQNAACEFVKEVTLLNLEDAASPIDVLIDPPGGEARAGLMMYDAIQASSAPIRLFCIGRAYSMAAVLLASGVNGRYILPHAEVMIHEPLLGRRVNGNSSRACSRKPSRHSPGSPPLQTKTSMFQGTWRFSMVDRQGLEPWTP